MTKGIEQLEQALKEGKRTITHEESAGLRGRAGEAPKKEKRKKSLARAMVRRFRELRYGPETYLYETPEERRKRVEMEKE